MNLIYTALKPVLLVNLCLAPITLFLSSSKFFFPYVATKAFFFYVVAQLAFVSWALLAHRYKEYRFEPNNLFCAFAAFVGISFLANIFGLNPYESFWSNSERMDGFLTLAHIFLYFTALLGALRTSKSWDYYLKYSLSVIVLVGLASVFKEWKAISSVDTYRLVSYLGNPIYMATVSVVGIFVSGMYFFRDSFSKENILKKVPYLFSGLFLIYIIFLTGTRGALVGVAFGLLAFCLTNFFTEKESRFLRILSGTGVAVFIIFVSSFFLLKDKLVETSFIKNNNLLNRAFNISVEDRTTRNRLATWEIAVDAFKDRPLSGYGQGGYEYAFSKYYKPEKLYDAETWFDRSHSAHLDKLVFSGIFGFMAYLAIYFFALRLVWTRKGIGVREKSALTGLLVAHFVQNSFVFESVSSHIVITTIFAYIGFSESEKKVDSSSDDYDKKYIMSAAVAVVALSVSLYHFVIKPASANKAFLKALMYQQIIPSLKISDCEGILASRGSGNRMTWIAKEYCSNMKALSYDESKKIDPFLEEIKYALSLDTLSNKEIIQKLILDTNLLRLIGQEKISDFDEMITENAKVLFDRYKDNNKLSLYYGLYLSKTGRPDLAEVYVNRALALGPEKFSNVNTKAEMLFRKGDIAGARKLTEEAISKGQNAQSVKLLQIINTSTK